MHRSTFQALAVAVLASGFCASTSQANTTTGILSALSIGGQNAKRVDIHSEAGVLDQYEQFQLPGSSNSRRVDILVPSDYDQNQLKYPVLYMNDGQSVFFNGGLGNKSIRLQDALSTLYREGAIPKMIVVAMYPTNRDEEYTHAPVFFQACCGLDEYARFVAKDVKPWVDANYRTLADREHTAFGGSSHGGLAAFYTVTHYPESFSAILGQSSSFWVGVDTGGYDSGLDALRGSKLLEGARATLANPALRPRIYVDWGLIRSGGFFNSWIEDQATERGKEMVELLQQDFHYDARNLMTVQDPQGQHEENSWARRLPGALRFLFGKSAN